MRGRLTLPRMIAGLATVSVLALLTGLGIEAVLLEWGAAGLLLAVRRAFTGGSTDHLPAGLADREAEIHAARAIAERYGEDSLSPFILRSDKSFHFAAEGVLAYRVVGETAVVSSDPVAPAGRARDVVASFIASARERGWRVAIWGASVRHLDAYRELGLHAVRVGEEAFVDPARFTLDGRRVRKLRQSVHRVSRRGWRVSACDGRSLGQALEREIDALDEAWIATRRRVLGFAMSSGAFKSPPRPNDLYLLARSPDGELGAVMRFVSHCGRLSLDSMRRVGDTPNGLNEALICHALEIARGRGVKEVSLNYAGLAHLVRDDDSCGRLARFGRRLVIRLLAHRFQLERLVRFNEKFDPEWRPRFLVYESRAALPGATLRVLQAEGYLSEPRRSQRPRPRPAPSRGVPSSPQPGTVR